MLWALFLIPVKASEQLLALSTEGKKQLLPGKIAIFCRFTAWSIAVQECDSSFTDLVPRLSSH